MRSERESCLSVRVWSVELQAETSKGRRREGGKEGEMCVCSEELGRKEREGERRHRIMLSHSYKL